MAKKPVKKPAKKAPEKKASAKKPAGKAGAAKKPMKKVLAKAKKPAAPAKKPAPVLKKAGAKVEAAKKAVEAKPVKAGKGAAPAAKAPMPPAEKPAKKGRAAAKPVEEVEVVEAAPEVEEVPEEMVLTDAEGRRFCRVRDCDQLAAVEGYCRYHYLLHWKKIQVRKKILTEGKLERYIEELTARYPDKFLDMLRKDLRSEKEFLGAIQELEIDESAMENELEEEAQTYIDEVRGMEPAGRETEEDF